NVLGIETGGHGRETRDVGEHHGDLLPFPPDGASGSEDLVSQVLRRVRLRGCKPVACGWVSWRSRRRGRRSGPRRGDRYRSETLAALVAELRPSRVLESTLGAVHDVTQRAGALATRGWGGIERF